MDFSPFQGLFLNSIMIKWVSRISETLGVKTAPAMTLPPSSDSAPFEACIQSACQRYQVPEDLVRAVIRTESNFDPNTVSGAGAKGLMQLMDGTAQSMGGQNSLDPAQNINGGVRFLHQMLQRYGNVRLALAAYNAGPGAVDRYGGIPPYAETQRYVQRVLGLCQYDWQA